MTAPTIVDSWDLITAAQTGDREAFGQIWDRYVATVYKFIRHRVADRALTEDFTSETFLRALRRIDSVTDQGTDVGAWLVTIALHLILDHNKKSSTRNEICRATPEDAAELSERPLRPERRRTDSHQWWNIPVPRDGGDPAHEVVSNAVRTELLRCIDQLTAEQRQVVVLRFLQGLSVPETAAAIGRNVGAVKALQHRGIRKLAELLPPDLL